MFGRFLAYEKRTYSALLTGLFVLSQVAYTVDLVISKYFQHFQNNENYHSVKGLFSWYLIRSTYHMQRNGQMIRPRLTLRLTSGLDKRAATSS